jgi:apolipoprotein D and lipocalin family protein
MKNLSLVLILQGLMAVMIYSQTDVQLKTVNSVDLKQYGGKWFEIARYSNKFQKMCVGNTTATYTVKENKEIEVLNECLEKSGKINKAVGKAKIIDKTTNAKLEVRFAPRYLSFLPQVWGDYWIIDLDRDYQYAVIGDPKREYFWILSRKPEMNDATYQAILRRAEANGFNPGKVYKTPQNVEVLKGEVIQKP